MELLRVVPLAQLEVHCRSLDDLDAGGTHAVARSHLRVHLLHPAVQGRVAVLLVHVVVPRPALVTEPDAVVLDGGGVLLKDLTERDTQTYILVRISRQDNEVHPYMEIKCR